MIFGSVKEGILEVLEERLSSFRSKMMAIVGAQSFTFREFRACGAPEYHGDKEPIASRCWLADVAIDGMPWDDFLTKFRVEFAPIIEVQ